MKRTKAVSFSLYGTKDLYVQGAFANAQLVREIYGDDWECVIYLEAGHAAKDALQGLATVVEMPSDFWLPPVLWRVLALDKYEVVVLRDLDSRLSRAEKRLVDEWLQSECAVHIIRGHPIHNFRIMAGLWGARKRIGAPLPDVLQLLKLHPKYLQPTYLQDQLFLQEVYYPLVKQHALIHDPYHQYADESPRRYATCLDFFGERVLSNGQTEREALATQSSKRFLFFVEHLDCFNTEQMGAFFFKLMEYVQIARRTRRILVLPNVYLSPRDNRRTAAEQRVVLERVELLSLARFFDLDELRKCVEVVPATEFFDWVLRQKVQSLLVHQPEKAPPVNEGQLFTYVGKLPVQIAAVSAASLNLLPILQSDAADKFSSVVVYDYERLGNPNWFHLQGLEYAWIRHCLVFAQPLRAKADALVEALGVRRKPTLMVHWRRGDIANVATMQYHMSSDEETMQWFHHKDHLSSVENLVANIERYPRRQEQVLLITDNGDDQELQELERRLPVIRVPRSGLDYFEYDLVCMLVGAQCDYHLHSPSSYLRMSQYGRWMLETKYIYYTQNNWIWHTKDDVRFIEALAVAKKN